MWGREAAAKKNRIGYVRVNERGTVNRERDMAKCTTVEETNVHTTTMASHPSLVNQSLRIRPLHTFTTSTEPRVCR